MSFSGVNKNNQIQTLSISLSLLTSYRVRAAVQRSSKFASMAMKMGGFSPLLGMSVGRALQGTCRYGSGASISVRLPRTCTCVRQEFSCCAFTSICTALIFTRTEKTRWKLAENSH